MLYEYGYLRICLAHFASAEIYEPRWTANVLGLDEAFVDREEVASTQTADPLSASRRERSLGNGPYEPPVSGWEFGLDVDLCRDVYDRWCGHDPQRNERLKEFRLWNRDMIQLVLDHPNVYVDISYFFLLEREYSRMRRALIWPRQVLFYHLYCNLREALGKHEKLRRRVLFGTDWYMVQQDVWSYRSYVDACRALLDRMADELGKQGALPAGEPGLWTQFTAVNPLRFYRIADIAPDFADRLVARGARTADVDEGLCSALGVQDWVDAKGLNEEGSNA